LKCSQGLVLKKFGMEVDVEMPVVSKRLGAKGGAEECFWEH